MKKNPVVPADIRDFLSADSINSFYFHYNIDIGFPCRHTFPIMFKLFFKLIIMGAAMSSLADDAVPTNFIQTSEKDGSPIMPKISFNTSDYPRLGSELVFKSKAEHARRKNRDDILISTKSAGLWDVNKSLNYKIFGGEMFFKYSNSDKIFKKTKVRGMNPPDRFVLDFIKKHCGEHWYAAAIGKHESRQRFYVFNQFNSAYYKPAIRGLPNCGLPDGWGIMQIDSKRGSQITTAETYDWRENVRGGIKVMDKARKEAVAYFNAVKRTFPDKWEEPPSHIVLEGTRTRLSYLDACVIQLYNGASVVRRLKTTYGTYSHYRSAFTFDEDASSGKRWKFKPNVNKYVYKVVSHEIEGGIKSENEPVK